MYAIYQKQKNIDGYRYIFKEQTSLFGCNSGYIPSLLQKQLIIEATEPFAWKLDLREALEKEGMANNVLVINLKPNSKEANLSLFELVNVWGYSSSGWTPIMIYIRGLFVDEDARLFNEKDFIRKEEEMEDPIFSMMYLNGTITQGKITGRWTPPSPSSTNSVLLWPDTLQYFSSEAQKIIENKA
jgi:hypothetical protein